MCKFAISYYLQDFLSGTELGTLLWSCRKLSQLRFKVLTIAYTGDLGLFRDKGIINTETVKF